MSRILGCLGAEAQPKATLWNLSTCSRREHIVAGEEHVKIQECTLSRKKSTAKDVTGMSTEETAVTTQETLRKTHMDTLFLVAEGE